MYYSTHRAVTAGGDGEMSFIISSVFMSVSFLFSQCINSNDRDRTRYLLRSILD